MHLCIHVGDWRFGRCNFRAFEIAGALFSKCDGNIYVTNCLEHAILFNTSWKTVLFDTNVVDSDCRSKDPELLDFLRYVRTRQPSRPMLAAFFRGKAMPRTLVSAVSFCEREAGDDPFTWLTVTNKGSREVNLAFAFARYGITDAQLEEFGIAGDHG